MTREEIIKLARKAGSEAARTPDLFPHLMNVFERFAALVAAAERSACAKVADSISEDQWALYKGRPPYAGKELERASEYTQGKSDGAEVCAYAIRARGQQ